MRAVVKYGQEPGMVELRDVPEPSVRPGHVIVEVKAAGVCGWDIEMWQHRMANPVTVPVVQGHEFCGVIAEAGEGVTEWRVGDRVACETSAKVCGSCRWCRVGEYQVCPERKGFGYGVDGAFTRFVLVRQEILHRLPENLSFNEGALTEPFCVAHNTLASGSGLCPGDTLAVIGPGPVGLTSLQIGRALGAARSVLIGTPRSRSRLDLAREQGWADATVDGGEQETVSLIEDLTHGEGVDVVVDSAGNSAALQLALRLVRRQGTIVKVGWGPEPFSHSLDELLRKSATMRGTFAHNFRNWRAVLALLEAGRLQAGPLITDVVPLSEWEGAFTRVQQRQAIKMVLRPEDAE